MTGVEPIADCAAPVVLPLIVLLTDFGSDDWFTGVMKGVIKTICPHAEVVDLCHNVPPHSVSHGGLMLSAAYRYFPPGSIFVAVVDPGVGTSRDPIIVRTADRWFVAPNNGLLNFLLNLTPAPLECRVLANSDYHLTSPSDTFHGRDIFAPCAAHLAAGVPWTLLAPRTTDLYGMPTTAASADCGVIEGNIIHFDHFGNALTNIPRELLNELILSAVPHAPEDGRAPNEFVVQVDGDTVAKIRRTYADVEPGETLAYWGSTGHLEIGINRGNAREQLEFQLLDKVTVGLAEDVR